MRGVQTLVAKSDQEMSIVDAKNSLMRSAHARRVTSGCHCCEREGRVGDACAEWVHNKLGSAILALAVEFSGQVVSRFQRSVSDGKTAYERRKQKSCRKALVPFGELVMFVPMENEIWNPVGIMLGLVPWHD